MASAQDTDKQIESLTGSALFDADWYADACPHVARSGFAPVQHYLRFGRTLKLPPGPQFDPHFYLATYADAYRSADAPLLVHLAAADAGRRPTTAALWQHEIDTLSRETDEKWLTQTAQSRPMRDISYCIPIAGRLEDLKQTLAENLKMNADYCDRIEFIIAELGPPGEVTDWATPRFEKEIETGYLRIVSDPTCLDSWHFGKAKNAFRPVLRGQVYSSLDGDNFVTRQETEKLLTVARTHTRGFVMHHFSGHWGDGTSGRVSLPAWLYRAVGYHPRLMPRQFDELDLILSTLKRFPAVPFIAISPLRHAFNASAMVRRFFEQERMPNRRIFAGDCHRIAPLNPRGSGYTDKAKHLGYMNNFNTALSAFDRSTSPPLRKKYGQAVRKYKHALVEAMPVDDVMGTFFDCANARPLPRLGPRDICLATCVGPDDSVFLDAFIAHYRGLGVTHFLVVDDGCARPVSARNLGDDIYAYRSKVGDRRSSKTMWMEVLINAARSEDGWVITVNPDEFLQLPVPYGTLTEVVEALHAQGLDFAPSLTLDMAPDPAALLSDLTRQDDNFVTLFDHFCRRSDKMPADYAAHRNVRQGFGNAALVSWRAALRHHLLGIYDPLAKISLFRTTPGRHIDQGFHMFHTKKTVQKIGSAPWTRAPILPLFRYKMVTSFTTAARTLHKDDEERTGTWKDQHFPPRSNSAAHNLRLKYAQISADMHPKTKALRPEFFRSTDP